MYIDKVRRTSFPSKGINFFNCCTIKVWKRGVAETTLALENKRERQVIRGPYSTAHMHPRKQGEEMITCQRMEKILRERNVSSKPFHVKVRDIYC